MKKKKKRMMLLNTFIILIILAISFFSITTSKNKGTTDEGLIKCIGEKSTLYVQLGCSHCRTQENLFGENLKYINLIDCFYENEKCGEVAGTPSWEINGEYYLGVKSIKKLKELTKC